MSKPDQASAGSCDAAMQNGEIIEMVFAWVFAAGYFGALCWLGK